MGDRMCEQTGKACHTFAGAKAIARQMRRSKHGDERPVSHYHCRLCDWWHVGSLARRRTRGWKRRR